MVTQGLIFPFNQVVRECEILKQYAREVLEPTTLTVLDRVKENLETIQKSASTTATTRWEIKEQQPLRTILSDGESQRDKKCRHKVRGVFSFIWEIRPLDDQEWPGRKHFVLDGKASTVVTVTEQDGEAERCLARWAAEIGDHQSPGTHFHFQMNRFDVPPFPKTLDIPRLPAPLMSPFLAIEAAIGELFQDRWAKHAAAATNETRSWRKIHRARLEKYFKWQAEVMEKS